MADVRPYSYDSLPAAAAAHQSQRNFYSYTLCLKNIPDSFNCNLKKDYRILIIFDTNIPDRSGHQMTVQFPTSLHVSFLGETEPTKYYILIQASIRNTTQKHVVSTFLSLVNCSLFQMIAVNVFEMSAHYAKTGMKMLSPFVDSRVENVLLRTNSGFTSRFLNTFLNVNWRHTAA